MESGIIGIPYIGKTTLFNALTALGVSEDGGAGKPNLGMAEVPDPRLTTINQYIETKKIVSATLRFVDVAGLVAGASEGKGTGNRFLSHVRNVDALLHVVRCFDDPNVPHIAESIDPVRDLEQVEIVNLGVGGFSPDQMLLRLRSDGLAYDPDLVLAFVPDLSGEPDGLSPFAGRERPRFELAEGALLLADGPELGEGFLSALAGRLERWLARHSSAYHLLDDSLRGVHAADRIDPRLRSATSAPASPPSAERLALGEALVVAMRDEAAESGAAFALVTQLDALHGAVRSRGVTSLDVGALLANPMFQLPGAPGRMDGRGNRALTHTLTAFLRESGLLAPQHWRTL